MALFLPPYYSHILYRICYIGVKQKLGASRFRELRPCLVRQRPPRSAAATGGAGTALPGYIPA